MKPLVSILIPAYNAELTIAETLESAVAQTWPRKEIIVVNDGSTDGTAKVAQRFASRGVKVVTTENGGLSAAVNQAYRHSQGDYIQELDADDLLLPDKIERQLAALQECGSKRVLASSPWASFYFSRREARFVRNSLWQDLSPVEWLLKKMGENLHMQNATWLMSREVAEAAGPWNEQLKYDQDGEYYTRVLLASDGTRFVPGTGILYRAGQGNRISYIGNSEKKKDSLLVSMKLHMQYLRSLEESDRVRKACVRYMQAWYSVFYPERTDIMAELQAIATELQGQLYPPRLSLKYAWMAPIIGYRATKRIRHKMSPIRNFFTSKYHQLMFKAEIRRGLNSASTQFSAGDL